MLIPAVSQVLNTGDTIVIFVRSGTTPRCSDESNKYSRGPESFSKQCLIILKFISSAPGLLFVFREKKASFNLFINRDWLGKVVLTLFKKLSHGIDGLGIFFAEDGPISPKYLLNSFAI